MYASASVKNFRCFEELVIRPLTRFNLIVGKNSVGKTALLEAITILHDYFRPNSAEVANATRGLGPWKSRDYLRELFHDFDVRKSIELSCTDDQRRDASLRIDITEHPTYTVPTVDDVSRSGQQPQHPRGLDSLLASGQLLEKEVRLEYRSFDGKKATGYVFVGSQGLTYQAPAGVHGPEASFLSADKQANLPRAAEAFSDVMMVKEEGKIVDILRIAEPRLKDLVVLQKAGFTMIYGDTGGKRLVEIPLMGAGVLRLLDMALSFFHARDGLVVIDEFESGLHYSVLKKVWKTIAIYGRELNVQLFATTHSNECVRAAHEAFAEEGSHDFHLHRLESFNGGIRAVTLDEDTLGTALEAGWEVR